MAREPEAHEQPDRLLVGLLHEHRHECRVDHVVSIINSASLPYVYRTDEEHRACGRIIRLARRVLAKRGKTLSFDDNGYAVCKA